ncbi:hypothetical protein [Algoriphagus marinus]|uniref:hypothetical protein n=1 Tax=Algoriphagus marinus TaxID=1925762 RepID=UPI00094B9B75|nr:hypothetical protein [Algoriphagus marinus]
MKNNLLLLCLAFLTFNSCTEESTPEELTYFFEVEVEGKVFRQEFSRDLPETQMTLVYQGGFNAQIQTDCISPPCITPFFVNMSFKDDLGSTPLEQIESISLPSGSYTTHYWYGGSNSTPDPTSGTVAITKKSIPQKLLEGSFVGEVYKNGTPTPVKIPIKGSFSVKL